MRNLLFKQRIFAICTTLHWESCFRAFAFVSGGYHKSRRPGVVWLASSIPTCSEAVDGTCPTGTPKARQEPNSAGNKMLKALGKARKKKSFLQDKMDTDDAFGFGGGLVTSGSFSMMASGGM